MIIKTYKCSKCESTDIVKNGMTKNGRQKHHCKECGKYGTIEPKPKYTEEEKAQLLEAYHERSSMRGISRVYGISRNTLVSWLEKKMDNLSDLEETLLPADPNDSIELDELWSFVGNKGYTRWVWSG